MYLRTDGSRSISHCHFQLNILCWNKKIEEVESRQVTEALKWHKTDLQLRNKDGVNVRTDKVERGPMKKTEKEEKLDNYMPNPECFLFVLCLKGVRVFFVSLHPFSEHVVTFFRSVQVAACWTALSLMPQRPQLWPSTSTSSTSTSAAGALGTTGGGGTDGPNSLTERAPRLQTHKACLSSSSSNRRLSDGEQTEEPRLEGQNVECWDFILFYCKLFVKL